MYRITSEETLHDACNIKCSSLPVWSKRVRTLYEGRMAVKRERKRARRLTRGVLYLFRGPARRRLEWKPNCRGLYTVHTCWGEREKEKEKEGKRESGGFRHEGRGERSYSTGMAMTGGSVYPAGDPIGWDGSLSPPSSCHFVASRRPTVWFALSHCVCTRAQLR